ncbi:nucleoid-structuring protein H-NS [Pseudomonas sp. NA13]
MGSPCNEVLGNHSKGWLQGFDTLWAQRGYPGIHAGMPTAQCLRSASVVNGAPEINVHREAA